MSLGVASFPPVVGQTTSVSGIPTQPLSLIFSARTHDAANKAPVLEVKWNKPANNGGAPVTAYNLKYRAQGSDTEWTTFTAVAVATTAADLDSCTTSSECKWKTHVAPGVLYEFMVCAVNANGAGPYSDISTNTIANSEAGQHKNEFYSPTSAFTIGTSVSATYGAAQQPTRIRDVEVTTTTPNTVSLQWSHSTRMDEDDIGADTGILYGTRGYRLQYRKAGSADQFESIDTMLRTSSCDSPSSRCSSAYSCRFDLDCDGDGVPDNIAVDKISQKIFLQRSSVNGCVDEISKTTAAGPLSVHPTLTSDIGAMCVKAPKHTVTIPALSSSTHYEFRVATISTDIYYGNGPGSIYSYPIVKGTTTTLQLLESVPDPPTGTDTPSCTRMSWALAWVAPVAGETLTHYIAR